jgi:hypothetical protein
MKNRKSNRKKRLRLPNDFVENISITIRINGKKVNLKKLPKEFQDLTPIHTDIVHHEYLKS